MQRGTESWTGFYDLGREKEKESRGMNMKDKDLPKPYEDQAFYDYDEKVRGPYTRGFEGEEGEERQPRHWRESRTGRYRERWNVERSPPPRELEGSAAVDVICVDGSSGADKAMHYALKNLPKSHSLLLVHGHYYPMVANEEKLAQMERKYKRMCDEAGRQCAMMHFNYTGTNDFGERVCRYSRRNNAKSIIVGRREDISEVRRTLLGSTSRAVVAHCDIPVTLVPGSKESFLK
jgi:hypothetical protein